MEPSGRAGDPQATTGAPSITPREFRRQLKKALLSRVTGMEWEDKLAAARQYIRELEARPRPEEESILMAPTVEIIPFEPGRRPLDEALNPGNGCSERVGYLNTIDESIRVGDDVCLLYRLRNLDAVIAVSGAASTVPPVEVTMSAWYQPAVPGTGSESPVPGLTNVDVPAQVIANSYPVFQVEPSSWKEFPRARYVATFSPARQLPAADPGQPDPFSFIHLFKQKLRVELSLRTAGRVISKQSSEVEVFDTGRFGQLYARLLDRLVKADTQAQAEKLGLDDLHYEYHPWFPVLAIGIDKANLYLSAIHEDLEMNRKNLPDPGWLLRVGLYLEFLTCLGIFEAVKDEYPDMLSPEERNAFENDPAFAQIRKKINVEAWKEVWALREVTPRTSGLFAAGPVSLTNMLRKEKATLSFLHAHHEDLKHAIELAGPNLNNAQETWHRVFRDAERAVLNKNSVAFPEMHYLEPRYQNFVLWHQAGDLRFLGLYAMPAALTSLFGDQDGLLPSACRQYRKSMNEVARWARERGLMDYTGDECIPGSASLLEAYMASNKALLAALQRRDGYGPTLEMDERRPAEESAGPEEIAALLRRVPVFKPLMERELTKLARKARRATFGPLDRILHQGQEGSSLFVLESGTVEVLVRQRDGRDIPVATLDAGAVFGEFGLLTGAARTATVRAIDEVVLYEISKADLQPIIEARPQLVVDLSMLMASRQSDNDRSHKEEASGIADRIRRFFFGG